MLTDGELLEGVDRHSRAAECGKGCGNSFHSGSELYGAAHCLTQPVRSEPARRKPDARSDDFDAPGDFWLVPPEWDGHDRNTVGKYLLGDPIPA